MNEERYCKYYNKHMDTLLAYFNALYKIPGCGAGGLLHVLLDDFNYDLHTIKYCYNECYKHINDREEAQLGSLIYVELFKLSTIERAVLFALWEGRQKICPAINQLDFCEDCPLVNDGLYYDILELDEEYLEEVKDEENN